MDPSCVRIAAASAPKASCAQKRSLEPYVVGSRVKTQVEVLQRYSRSPDVLERVQSVTVRIKKQLQPQAQPSPMPRPRHSMARRLSNQARLQLVEDYQAGDTTRDIALRYGISKTAVLRLLKGAGADIRPRGPVPSSRTR